MAEEKKHFTCPHCGRLLATEEWEFLGRVYEFAADCECAGARAERDRVNEAEGASKRAAALSLARQSGVPMRFANAKSMRARQIADRAASGRGTYIVGPVGTGKTHIACAALMDFRRRNPLKTARFVSSSALLSAIRGEFGSGGSRTIEDDVKQASLLVLDDLGKERPTAWALECLFTIIDARYAEMLPTIVTTQYLPSELAQRMAENGDADTAQAIISRLRADCETVRTEGTDKRLRR